MGFERWDVLTAPFPFVDAPVRKPRPVLVLSAGQFNHENGHVIAAMITTGARSRWPGDHAIVDLAATGLNHPSVGRWKVFTLPFDAVSRGSERLLRLTGSPASRSWPIFFFLLDFARPWGPIDMCRTLGWTVVLFLLFTPCSAQTAPQYFGLADIGAGGDLSVREEPDGAAAVVTRIPGNVRQVRGFGCTTDTPSGLTWCRVKYRGVLGWARRRYLVPAR